MLQLQENTDYERFVHAFHRRYKEELKYVGLVSQAEMVQLYIEYRGSGKTPEQWLEQQEMS